MSQHTTEDLVKNLIALGLLDATGRGHVGVLTETILASALTDGGGAVGTKQFVGALPAGAYILGTRVLVSAGFAGDVSATFTVGDGSDADRYNTGTPSCFAAAATGVDVGIPSGVKCLTAANKPTVTVTSNADITPVLAGGGSMAVSIYYIRTQD